MKRRTISSREFQHKLADITTSLKPGETLLITKRGEPLGTFTKAKKRGAMPDFLANLKELGERAPSRQDIIDEICGIS